MIVLNFIIAGYVSQILGKGERGPPSASRPKKPILNRVKIPLCKI